MNRLCQVLGFLPRSVRSRVVAAFMLMAAFPVLGAILAVSDRMHGRVYSPAAIGSVLALCMVLSCFGFWELKSLLISVIDIRDFTKTLVKAQAKLAKGGGDKEVAKLGHLVAYMHEQMEAARQLIQHHYAAFRRHMDANMPVSQEKEAGVANSHVRITMPPLVPRSALPGRMREALNEGAAGGKTVGVVACRSAFVSVSERADDSLVPGWLRVLVAEMHGAAWFVARIGPGHWIVVLRAAELDATRAAINRLWETANSLDKPGVSLQTWCHPLERFDVGTAIQPALCPHAAIGAEGGVHAVPDAAVKLMHAVTGTHIAERRSAEVFTRV